LKNERYKLGTLNVIIENGICKLGDGTIAESTLTLNRAEKNLVKIGIKLEDALRIATSNPAGLLKLDCGKIKKGFKANFMLLDSELNVKEVYVGGEHVYRVF